MPAGRPKKVSDPTDPKAVSSAKGLYKALRAKPQGPTGPPLIAGLADQSAPEAQRRAHDFYPTVAPDAVRGLLAADGDRIRSLGGHTWEPACGDGQIAREILAAGMTCTASDLIWRGYEPGVVRSYYDFSESPAPVIITNPPYAEINARDGHGRWLRHALTMPGWRYMALLLSWDWPAAKLHGLGALLDAAPFTRCYLMRWKLDFTGEGSPPQRNGWFVWDRDDPRYSYRAPYPDFRLMDRDDDRQREMFAESHNVCIDPYRNE